MRYDEIMNAGLQAIKNAKIDERWLNLGAETQSQNRLNREYLESLTLEMRLLGSEVADTSTTLFGVKLPAPIITAALWMSGGRVLLKMSAHSQGFYGNIVEEFAAGVTEANSLMSLGISRETNILPNMIDRGAKVVSVVKPIKDKEKIVELLKWSEDIGCVAVGMDVDAMFGEKAYDQHPGPTSFVPQSIADLQRYKAATDLPFIIKGVLSVQDAKIAKNEINADAIVVSNHGGEALDYSIPILKVLPEIREAVGEDMCVLVDSGFRRGTDILKALALGADGVGILTLLVIAFAAYERAGVANMFQVLYNELQRAMSLTCCTSMKDIDPSIIRYP